MKKNNKLNKIIILSIIGLIFLVAFIIFILNYTKDSSSLSILEKNWLNNHKSNVVDVSIYNDVPVFGKAGKGIAFSYLEKFTSSYGIEFNKVSYLTSGNTSNKEVSFRVLNYNDKLTDKDIPIYQDKYVIVSSNDRYINGYEDLEDKNIGVLDKDVINIRYFIGDSNKKILTYKNIDELIDSEDIDYMIIPYMIYIDKIIENDLHVVYHMNDLYQNYVLTVNDDKTLLSIMNKYMMIYQEKLYKEDYNKYLIDTFFESANIDEVEKMNYNANSYIYGYVINMPYENTINKEFVGIFSNYLSKFEDLVDVDFKIVGYKNITELKQAFSRGEVDLLYSNFSTQGVNVDVLNTVSPLKEEFVILGKNNIIIDSIRSLKELEVLTVSNTYLYDYLVQNGIKIKGYTDTDNLLRNIANDSIVAISSETYEYYKKEKFKDYKVLYIGKDVNEYTFAIRNVNKNKTFYKLFNFYIESINYKDIKYNYNTNYILNSFSNTKILITALVSILSGVFLIGILLYLFNKRKNKKKKDISKDDKMKFIDVMTSLKNRNYLNYNIKTWEENVIYPQAIVIIDLNNIKYINDNFGHAEGDEVIKKAASMLIVNQLENTDIVRTDGNEFLIYMVGYDEKKVQEHMRKLSKELKELPHDFGASLGYSMILDDVKTIDDAINEATLAMRNAKEKL